MKKGIIIIGAAIGRVGFATSAITQAMNADVLDAKYRELKSIIGEDKASELYANLYREAILQAGSNFDYILNGLNKAIDDNR